MWYGRQASPASSTSTVDQQEIIFDDNQTQQHIQQPITNLAASSTAHNLAKNATTTTNATTGSTTKRQNSRSANKRSANLNSKCSPPKRPKLFNSHQQSAPWKSLQHHFQRHTDVKYRPEKRMTMAELGSEVLQRRNGWKVHHLVGQLTDLIQNEVQTRDKISSLLQIFNEYGANRVHDLADNCHKLPEQYATLLTNQRSYGMNEFKAELIVTKLEDLLRGDLQRSSIFDEQLKDCRDLVVRITNEHRDRVAVITTKFNKRIQL